MDRIEELHLLLFLLRLRPLFFSAGTASSKSDQGEDSQQPFHVVKDEKAAGDGCANVLMWPVCGLGMQAPQFS